MGPTTPRSPRGKGNFYSHFSYSSPVAGPRAIEVGDGATEAQDNMGPTWLQEDVTGHWLTFPIIGRLQFLRLQLQMLHLDFAHFYDMFIINGTILSVLHCVARAGCIYFHGRPVMDFLPTLLNHMWEQWCEN
uniref:Uncharacterized protein n=1 Tax=Oryza meridionalis TaxID=40149 RepID=A0A0E0FAB3_9ORYZ